MKIPFDWENVDHTSNGYTERAKVIGGWLVRSYEYDNGIAYAMCFVPDVDHEWEI